MASVELADLSAALNAPTQRRFSATQAVFQFAALAFLAVLLIAVVAATTLDAPKSAIGRLLMLACGASLVLPAALAARLLVITTTPGTSSNRSFSGSIKLVVAALGLSTLLFFAAALIPQPESAKTILDPQRDTARFLFGIDDLGSAKLLNYSKADGKVAAEFAAAGRKITITVTPEEAAP